MVGRYNICLVVNAAPTDRLRELEQYCPRVARHITQIAEHLRIQRIKLDLLEQIRSGKPSRNWRNKRRARGPGYPAYYVCLPSWQPEQYLRDEKVFKLRKYLSCKNKWGQFLAGWHSMKDNWKSNWEAFIIYLDILFIVQWKQYQFLGTFEYCQLLDIQRDIICTI